MATDPSLSDSNLPESSAQLGWESWVGSKASLNRDDEWLKQAFIKHLGQDYWNSRNEYPHPNQLVNDIRFYEGNGRIDTHGFEVVVPDGETKPGIRFVPEFTQDDTTYYPQSSLFGSLDESPTGEYSANLQMFARAENTLFRTSFVLTDNSDGYIGGDNSQIQGSVGDPSGSPMRFTAFWDKSSSERYFSLENGPLYWPAGITPFVNRDGQLWYYVSGGGVDSFRVRLSGVTYDLLHSGSVIVLSNLDVPFDAYSANQLLTSTNCFVTMDASGASRTFTLPSAATLGSGFTYVFKKIDSSNNTVTIDPNSTQTVDGVTTYVLTKQYETLCATSDGTNWVIWSAYNNELYVAQTATFTVGPRDTTISVSTAAGAVTANLPTAVGIAGREITIKKTTNDANFLTLDGSGSETIEGVSTYIITSIGEVTIYSNGANWLVKSESFGGYITRTTTYTTTITDRKVTANASGGAFTITLIAASSVAGERVMFRKIGTDTNLVTLDANSSETIDGAATLGLMTPGEWAELLSDGTNWLIVGYGS